jgi:hypothetical protein
LDTSNAPEVPLILDIENFWNPPHCYRVIGRIRDLMNLVLRVSASWIFLIALVSGASAQQLPNADPNSPPDKRVFGVLPNYRTALLTADYHPITPKQKLIIASKDSFDYPLVLLGAAYAGLYQLENSHPQFGQGFKGYLKRFGTSYTDQVVGNMLTEGLLPIAFHEDPRYFRLGEGTKRHRAAYAFTRIFVTRTDSGGKSFNFAEVVGNGTATLIGWSYYTDTRNAPDFFQAFGTQLATDAVSQMLKEFWPDVKRHFKHHSG